MWPEERATVPLRVDPRRGFILRAAAGAPLTRLPSTKLAGGANFMGKRVAVIGPTNLPRIARASGSPLTRYRRCAQAVGRLLARLDFDLVVVPDRGVAILALEAYRSAGGRNVIGLIPSGGDSDAGATENCLARVHVCDQIITGLTWQEQHAAICHVSDCMVGVGLSCGTLAEIAWTKWVRGPEVLLLRSTVTGLPAELLAEARVRFVRNFRELRDALTGAQSDVSNRSGLLSAAGATPSVAPFLLGDGATRST